MRARFLYLGCALLFCTSATWWLLRHAASRGSPPIQPPREERPLDVTLPVERPPRFREWVGVEDFTRPLARCETVFWEPADTESLRELIRSTDCSVRGKRVLEIGTGTGLIALCCAQAGAEFVVATDINPQAVNNARYNAAWLGVDERTEFRLVSREAPGAYRVLRAGEKFDVIISNPPWENDKPRRIEDFALYDEDFKLLHSLLEGLRERLRPGGKAYLAYGCVTAIETIQRLGAKLNIDVRLLDERRLEELPDVFLPGLLIELAPRVE